MHPAVLPEENLLADCSLRNTRRSGPGGQHRNKVETAVVIQHNPTQIEAEANERRSQAENRKVAIFRLRLKLAIEYRSSPVPGTLPDTECTSPSAMWLSRVKGGRIQVADNHSDFPSMLAEALDCLESCEHNLSKAAEALQVSASQLAKLFRKYPPAMQAVNRQRQRLGLRKLT